MFSIWRYGHYRARRPVLEAWDRLGLASRNRTGGTAWSRPVSWRFRLMSWCGDRLAGILSEAEVDCILTQGQLQLTRELVWRRQGSGWKFAVSIDNSQDLDLALNGYWNPKSGKFSFALGYTAANQALRRYCSRGRMRIQGHPKWSSVAGTSMPGEMWPRTASPTCPRM